MKLEDAKAYIENLRKENIKYKGEKIQYKENYKIFDI